jgi:acetylglutamate kinase
MLKIVKIGGNIVDNPAKLQNFIADFASLPGDKILIHGGGKIATAISAALGIETTMIDGRRVTDTRTLEVVTMVYNGINKQIVSALQGEGCNAIGLCGADGRLIVSQRRSPKPIDYGFVGDPVEVNSQLAKTLIDAGFTLVVAPITLENEGFNTNKTKKSGSLLNTNADTVAQSVAVAMSVAAVRPVSEATAKTAGAMGVESKDSDAVELIYCFEKQGVMADVDDENSVIPLIDKTRFAELKAAGTVHSGMLPKLENAFRALEKGVAKVVICAAENIARPGYGGTTITL